MIRHSEKIQLERDNRKPVFVQEELYFKTDLTFTEVFIKCRELGLKKMINIADETIQAWYIEFLREEWSSKKFNDRISEMRNIKTYGERIDIADWFEKEAIYTPTQVANMIQIKIQEMLSKADRLLCGKEIELEIPGVRINLDFVKYKIAKTVSTYYNNECEEKSKELFEEILPEILKKLNLKKENNNQKVGIGTRLKQKFNF